MPNRIASFRKKRGLSQQQLADALDVDKSTIWRYEAEKTSLFNDNVVKIAKYFGLDNPELLLGQEETVANLIGTVGAGETVYPVDDGSEWISAPPGFTGAIAVRVVGTSMVPVYRPGDILFASVGGPPEPSIVGKDCIVQLPDGCRLVKRVVAGSSPSHFRLYSYESTDLSEDIELEWVAPVRWVAR